MRLNKRGNIRMLYLSAEVRWFGKGTVRSDVEKWFSRIDGQQHDEKPRVDAYLIDVVRSGQGIKVRDGKLEVKWCRQHYGQQQFALGIAGNVEYWCKLSSVLNEQFGAGELADDGAWLSVEKRRTLRKYEFRAPATVVAVGPETRPATGCNLELTRLQIVGNEWWTIGFEAFGEVPDRGNILQRTVKHVLADDGTLVLASTESLSYPQWLAEITTSSVDKSSKCHY